MKTIFIIGLTLLVARNSYCQNIDHLIEKLICTSNFYQSLDAYDQDVLYALSDYELQADSLAEYMDGHNDSLQQDSIIGFNLIDYYQSEIDDLIHKICMHPKFNTVVIEERLRKSGVNVAVSEDRKMFNFSYYSKNGGTAIMMNSYIFYMPWKRFIEDLSDDFYTDGYQEIYKVQNGNTDSYLFIGSSRGCTSCFISYFQYFDFDSEDLSISLRADKEIYNRSWEQEMQYSPNDTSIFVSYLTDDFMGTCQLDQDLLYDQYVDSEFKKKKCELTYKFNGDTFVFENSTEINFEEDEE